MVAVARGWDDDSGGRARARRQRRRRSKPRRQRQHATPAGGHRRELLILLLLLRRRGLRLLLRGTAHAGAAAGGGGGATPCHPHAAGLAQLHSGAIKRGDYGNIHWREQEGRWGRGWVWVRVRWARSKGAAALAMRTQKSHQVPLMYNARRQGGKWALCLPDQSACCAPAATGRACV